MVAETAMKWTKVLRTGAIEAKFMGLDLTTIMFNMDRGQNIAEVCFLNSIFSFSFIVYYMCLCLYACVQIFWGRGTGNRSEDTNSFHEANTELRCAFLNSIFSPLFYVILYYIYKHICVSLLE